MSRYDLSRGDLASLLAGEPSYRLDQLWDGLYAGLGEPSELTTLPVTLRRRLGQVPELGSGLRVVGTTVADNGDTSKWLFALDDGALIETVLMVYPDRATVCVSSQAGCAMACTFCATGQAGYRRQLSVGEIVEQVVWAAREAPRNGRRLDHVVFMGMGEPLANYSRVLGSIRRIVGDLGIGARRVTVSTVGVIPGIDRLAGEGLQINLAVSLHAANDALRDQLVPLNRRHRLAALMDACGRYVSSTRRRISFEWALIADVNDSTKDARELSALARQLGAHVNVIPLNPTPQGPSKGMVGPGPDRVRRFRDELTRLGVNVTVRSTRGQEIGAACGQLAGEVLAEVSPAMNSSIRQPSTSSVLIRPLT